MRSFFGRLGNNPQMFLLIQMVLLLLMKSDASEFINLAVCNSFFLYIALLLHHLFKRLRLPSHPMLLMSYLDHAVIFGLSGLHIN